MTWISTKQGSVGRRSSADTSMATIMVRIPTGTNASESHLEWTQNLINLNHESTTPPFPSSFSILTTEIQIWTPPHVAERDFLSAYSLVPPLSFDRYFVNKSAILLPYSCFWWRIDWKWKSIIQCIRLWMFCLPWIRLGERKFVWFVSTRSVSGNNKNALRMWLVEFEIALKVCV